MRPTMTIRVKRVSHVNVNCSNLDRSLAFYRDVLGIGLEPLFHTAPPPQPLPGLGLGAEAQWDAHILYDRRGFPAPAIDLLEWKSPRPAGVPYPNANHVGMFRVAFLVRDLDALYRRLIDRGVSCYAPPAEVDVGTDPPLRVRVFCCHDPDGTTLEFIAGDTDRLVHVNINCSDLERSRRFYQDLLGFIPGPFPRGRPAPQPGEPFGFAAPCQWDAHFLSLPGEPDAFLLDLLEWQVPRPIGHPYPNANHLGIFRLALIVDQIDAVHAELETNGVECLTPAIAMNMGKGLPSDLRVFLCRDPDGTIVEFIEDPVV